MNAKNIFGAVCVGAALFFLWPAVFGSWSELQALRAAVSEREALVSERAEILSDADAEYGKLQDLLGGNAATAFTSLIPTKKAEAELVSAASSIAVTSGLQLTSIQITDTSSTKKKSKDPYETLLMKMELTGSYSGLRAYLTDLEAYVRLLNVRIVSVTSETGGEGLRFVIEANTYYIR